MPRIELPDGYAGSENLPKTNTILQNGWKTPEKRFLPRPGITQLNTTSRVARGGFKWNGSLYQVASGDLIKITNVNTGAFSVIGTIDASDPIETAIGFNTAVIVVRGGKSYTLDKSDVLVDTAATQISFLLSMLLILTGDLFIFQQTEILQGFPMLVPAQPYKRLLFSMPRNCQTKTTPVSISIIPCTSWERNQLSFSTIHLMLSSLFNEFHGH